MNESSISPEQLDFYEQNGYLIIDDPCPSDLPDKVIGYVEPLISDAFDPGPQWEKDGVVFTRAPRRKDAPYHWHRVKNLWKWNDDVRAMALAPKVLAATEAIFGRRALPFQTLNFPIGTQQPAHHDSMAFNSDPPGYMCGVWIALEDIDMDNGPLVYYPGSNKLPTPTWQRIEEETGYRVNESDYPTYDEFMLKRNKQTVEYCALLIEKHGFEPEYGTIRKGQALLWAPNILHGGAPQRDKSRTRHSQVTHYFFEGCRHYTPLRAGPDHIYWDYPEWIKDPVPSDTAHAIHEAIKSVVPENSILAIATDGYEGLLEPEGRIAWHFPQAEDGTHLSREQIGDDPIEHLERLRAKGAQYIVFPKRQLAWLENVVPALQGHLETRYRALARDGGVCVIYALDQQS